jgi:hypothetical protein
MRQSIKGRQWLLQPVRQSIEQRAANTANLASSSGKRAKAWGS